MLSEPRDFFGRVVRAVTERPLATIAVVAALALGGLVLALQLAAERRHGARCSAGRSSAPRQGHRALPPAVRRRGDRRAREGDRSNARVLTVGPRSTCVAPGGLPVRQHARAKKVLAGSCRKACRSRRATSEAREGRVRAGHVRQHRGEPDPEGFQQRQAAARPRGQAAGAAARKLAQQKGYSKAAAGQVREQAAQRRPTQVPSA